MLDLNLTSSEAQYRVGIHLNLRYKQVLSELGMNDFTRVMPEVELAAGTQLQEYADEDPIIERIVNIFRQDDGPTGRYIPLTQITYDEMQEKPPTTDVPRFWCRKRQSALSTIFMIDSTIPDGQNVFIEGEEHASELADDAEPAFSESYQDILIFGAKADEYRKQKDAASLQLAQQFEGSSERPDSTPNSFWGRMAKLKLKQALMAYGDIYQGKTRFDTRLPWMRGR